MLNFKVLAWYRPIDLPLPFTHLAYLNLLYELKFWGFWTLHCVDFLFTLTMKLVGFETRNCIRDRLHYVTYQRYLWLKQNPL